MTLIGNIASINDEVLTGNIVGIKGDTGTGIANIIFNDDYTMTILLTDGSSYTTEPISGFTDIAFDSNYDLIITKTDGTTVTVETDLDEYRTVLNGYKNDAGTSASSATLQALKSEGYADGKQNGEDVSSGEYYHNNSKYYKEMSAASALVAEGWAKGTQNGIDVQSGNEYYQNNAKYFAENINSTIEADVNNWLISHPEATTTVQDGSLTEPKFSDALKLKTIKDYVTPEMFGAKGDGETDDSDALNELFASVDDKYIFIPSGTYFCASDVTLNLTDNNIVGAGEYETVIKLDEGVSFTINKERNTFSNLRFQGGNGVICNKYHNTFISCWFQNSEIGIQLNSGYICQFTNCYITHNKLGVLLNNQSYETIFVGCVIDNNIVGAIVCGDSSGCVFECCTVEGNYNRTSDVGCGVFICSANTRTVISKCHFEQNGKTQTSVDIFAHSSRATAATDFTDLYSEIEAVYDGSMYLSVGIISVSDCRFYATKYGVVAGGSDAKFIISNNYFSGILSRGNKPILINGASLLTNEVIINNNVVKNTNNSAITTEMLDGIKSSYVYTDIVPAEGHYNALIDGQIVLDDVPLFLYRGRALSLEGTKTYPQIICADGTSHDGGLINGNLTNYFTGTTKALYVSPDGVAYNLFAQSGYNEFIAMTNNGYARVGTSNGWISWTKEKNNVYPIKRLTLNNREMLTRDNAMVFMLIELSSNDIKKMQGCLAFEPTDLSVYEFR